MFTDPRTATTYTWPFNPGYQAETQATGKTVPIQRTSNTGNVGAVRQQGDAGPAIIHWEFDVFHTTHEAALLAWFELSQKQSIYLTDFEGEQNEGQIIVMTRQRIGAVGGPGDMIAAFGFYEKFVFEFEIWRFISGAFHTAGVAA